MTREMTRVVDLHPEELLDRDARGELTADEETRLEAHLARCAACRFERQLRGDFAAELASDVTPSSVERIALAGSSPPKAPPPAVDVPREEVAALPPRRRPRRATRAAWLLVAAAVCGVSVAGATGVGQRAWLRIVGADAAVPASFAAASAGESSPSHVAAKHVARHRTAPAASALSAPRPEPSTVDVLVQTSAPPLAELSPATLHHASRTARRALGSPAADGAASLFESATEARREGSYARAIELQRELLSRYPRSSESHVARETMGRLLLDRGDPAGAFASFEAYLSEGSGELGEEAMVGRATALERLGRSAQAADAWRGLLAAYPETSYAAHARSRLGSLNVR
jgi:TolA-binding protein